MSRYLAEGKVAAGLALSHGPSVLVVALGCQPPGGPVLLAKRESDLSVSVRQFTTNRRNRDERGEEAVDSADERDFGEIIELIRSQGCGTLGGESFVGRWWRIWEALTFDQACRKYVACSV